MSNLGTVSPSKKEPVYPIEQLRRDLSNMNANQQEEKEFTRNSGPRVWHGEYKTDKNGNLVLTKTGKPSKAYEPRTAFRTNQYIQKVFKQENDKRDSGTLRSAYWVITPEQTVLRSLGGSVQYDPNRPDHVEAMKPSNLTPGRNSPGTKSALKKTELQQLQQFHPNTQVQQGNRASGRSIAKVSGTGMTSPQQSSQYVTQDQFQQLSNDFKMMMQMLQNMNVGGGFGGGGGNAAIGGAGAGVGSGGATSTTRQIKTDNSPQTRTGSSSPRNFPLPAVKEIPSPSKQNNRNRSTSPIRSGSANQGMNFSNNSMNYGSENY